MMPYDDILDKPHHVSRNRPRMSAHDRAAQFSPFAALTGYEESIEEMRRIVDTPVELETDEIAVVDEKIRLLMQRLEERPVVTVTYFQPDPRKPGGAYVTVTGVVKRVEDHTKCIRMADETVIRFERITGLEFAEQGETEGR